MPLIKRLLKAPPIDPAAPASPVDAQGKALYSMPKYYVSSGCVAVEGRSAQSVCRTVHLIQLTKIIEQLSEFSLYAHEVFNDLAKASASVDTRLKSMQGRMESVKRVLPLVEKKMVADLSLTDRPDWKAPPMMEQQLFLKGSANPSVEQVYNECFPVPNLAVLDKFREDGQTCMKFFSYPQFFMEQWKLLMEKEQQQRKLKKKGKKKVDKKKAIKVSEVKVKRYNKMGELILDEPNQANAAALTASNEKLDESQPVAPSSTSGTAAPTETGYTIDTLKKLEQEAISLTIAPEIDAAPVETPSIEIQIQSPVTMSEPVSFASLQNDSLLLNSPVIEPAVASVLDAIPESNESASISREPSTVSVQKPVEAVKPPPPPAPAPAPPPPPPPPPALEENDEESTTTSIPGAPAPPPAPALPANTLTADAIANAAGMLKKKPKSEEPPPKKDVRNEMLTSIRGGGFNLRRVQVQPKKATNETDKPGSNDVASILMRRIALEMSDSESGDDDEDEDAEWD
jgi:WAS family protein 2